MPAWPSYPGSDSRTTFIPIRLQFLPVERTKLALLRAISDALAGGTGLVPADLVAGRNKARDLLAVASDRHFLSVLDEIQQVAELVLRFEGAKFRHVSLVQTS